MNVALSADALADVEQAADWYIDHDAWPAARDFHGELTRALARLTVEPGLGTPGPEGVRILPIHRFPYSLVYRYEGEEVRVLAVAAQRRRPGFWSGRR
jgi:plasmid stabilization system protein ParE